MERPSPSDMTPKRDHGRDVELDKKIEALRRKNETLMKRYKEVEEDKKRAEDDGMAPQSRKGQAEDLTITINKSTSGKRVVSERPEKRPDAADVKSPTEDGPPRGVESAGRGKQPPHRNKRSPSAAQAPDSPLASTDLDIPTQKEEQEEYLRWKKEREQIDKERVARHKNAKGQWRRAWDVDKTENMFSDKSLPERDWGTCSRGGRSAKRGQPRANVDRRGREKRGKDKVAKKVPVMSSKAKGTDRLTGRARRWLAGEEGENLQMSDTTLEEFLEELDALTDVDVEDQTGQDTKTKPSTSSDLQSVSDEVSGSAAPVSAATLREDASSQGRPEALSPRSSEKKVRFSEELIQGARTRQTAGSQESASTESNFKASSPKKNKQEVQGPQQPFESSKQDDGSPRDQGDDPSASPVAQWESNEIDCTKNDNNPPKSPNSPPAEKACASPEKASLQPVELAKCNISSTNTEELIDSGLSVLSLESGETHLTHCTSSDKAREHGKIV